MAKTYVCNRCHSMFDSNEYKPKYCSRKCFGEAHSERMKKPAKEPNTVCSYCQTPIHRNLDKLPKSGLSFCCRAHKDLAQRIDSGFKTLHPSHYGDETSNYRVIAFRLFPHQCNRCGYKAHPILQVHHKDRNRENNDPSNLEILCPNCHETEHYLTKTGRHLSGPSGT